MLTTRISPKISVKPLATTKYSAAAVSPLSSVMKKSLGSSIAGPKLVPEAMNSTQIAGKTTMASSTARPTWRSDPYAANPVTRAEPNPARTMLQEELSRIGTCPARARYAGTWRSG